MSTSVRPLERTHELPADHLESDITGFIESMNEIGHGVTWGSDLDMSHNVTISTTVSATVSATVSTADSTAVSAAVSAAVSTAVSTAVSADESDWDDYEPPVYGDEVPTPHSPRYEYPYMLQCSKRK